MTNEAPLNDRSSANAAKAPGNDTEAKLTQLRNYAARITTESDLRLAERELAEQRIQALQAALETLHALAQSTDDAAILRQAIGELRNASQTPPR